MANEENEVTEETNEEGIVVKTTKRVRGAKRTVVEREFTIPTPGASE